MPKKPKKDKKVSKNIALKDSKALAPIEPGLMVAEEVSREDKFIQNLFLFDTVREAGIAAGYSEQYSDGPLCQRLRNPKIVEKIKKVFLTTQASNLPLIAKVYENGLKHLAKAENIGDYPKLQQIDKRILQMTKLLGQDVAPPVTINIQEVQQLMLSTYAQGQVQPEKAEFIDVEPVEVDR